MSQITLTYLLSNTSQMTLSPSTSGGQFAQQKKFISYYIKKNQPI